jgi:hypothetical protein
LDRQEEEISQLRTRTGTLLAAGSLVVSFFGAAALGKSGTGPWPALAIVAFVLFFVASIYLLAPKTALVFSLSGPGVYEETEGQQIGAALLQTARWLHGARESNQRIMDRLNVVFAAACVALVLEVIFWTLALRSTI